MNRSCLRCRQSFEITDDDLAFLDKVSPAFNGKQELIPPPTLCPECRWRRRLAFRNERNLYHRTCDLSGKSVISMHPAETPFPVFHITEWKSDKWDPLEYGRNFDFSRSFAEQFRELCNVLPHFTAFVDPSMDENAEYTNCSSEAKNCYMITQAEKNEDCYYSRGINTCKSCCDCLRVHRCELCYECINTRNCYRCLYCRDCDDSSDCFFSSDLHGCHHCFGCHGLIRKNYHIFNQPVSQEEWEERIGSLRLTHDLTREALAQSDKIRLSVPHRAVRLIQCENASGDDLLQCKNAVQCFDCNDLEDCAYCNELANAAKDCRDFCMFGIDCELLYECSGGGYGMYHDLFCNHCWNNVSDLLYCESCFPSVKHCFGCFGLRNAEYCIFNKQYTKEEYEALVPKIIEHMRSTGEWGEFFPMHISAYAYNESLAQEFFPLTKEEVTANGWQWREEESEYERYLGPDVTPPASIEETDDSICDAILRCADTQKPYRITKQELSLYRQLGVPVPLLNPTVRHMTRMQARNPRQLWDRQCMKCSKDIQTTYAPDRPEIVYCESCYLSSVY